MTIHFTQRNQQWDSLLFPVEDNRFELTLQFRIRMVRIEPTTSFADGGSWARGDGLIHNADDNQTFHLQAWNDLEWETYKIDFQQLLERAWKSRFVLIPNKAWYSGLKGNPLIPAPVQCSLAIQTFESSALPAHFTFRCIHTNDRFRSYASPQLRAGVITQGNLTVSWLPRATKVGTQVHQIEYGQVALLHEFGHMLGFGHINGSGNSERDYGISLEQRENLMGMGSQFTDRQASPWIATLKRHLIPENKYDRGVKFTGHVNGPQIIAYWDNDWTTPPATTPPPSSAPKGGTPTPSGVPHSVDPAATQGPAGVTWQHMEHIPTD